MSSRLLCSAAMIALLGVGPVRAAGPSYDWSGFYLGVVAGGAWGRYDPRTSTGDGPYIDAVSAATVTAAGAQTVKQSGFATGIEGGYNWQSGNLLLGLETDLQAIHLNGATNTGAIPYPSKPGAFSFTITSYGNSDWLFTARPRVGVVAPNNWLFYATGGLALTQLRTDFSFVDNFAEPEDEEEDANESGRVNTLKAGYTVGGGIEAPLTNQLSVKADYLHVSFPNTAGTMTASIGTENQVFMHSSDLRADIFRAGLNYRFNSGFSGSADPPGSGIVYKAPTWKAPTLEEWQVETGARLWLSTGVDGEGPLFNGPSISLASRLIYGGLDAVSGETFARVDHVSGIFVKGYLGAGGIYNGHLNDEDFPGEDVYSNTRHTASGHIGYATVDVGYNFLTVPGAKVGAFVGYNYFAQAINTYGCTQIAGDSICSPPDPPGDLGLTETDSFNSLRVGLSSQVMLTDRLRLTSDAAYVPWVTYSGLDDHLARQLLAPDSSNSGNGVMLEAALDYTLSDHWSVGIGGRYWAWNMNAGPAGFNFLVTPAENSVESSRYSTERYGMFVQSSYRWGDPPYQSAAVSPMPTKAPPFVAAGPVNWTGFYVGGHLGGGWSDARWSDPFGSMQDEEENEEEEEVAEDQFVNVAGFGNHTHATGPLGGVQVGANWQTGPWVLGGQVDASAANLRGENTCFSGLGGINCQHVVNSFETFTGRIGYAWGSALLYVRGGGAWTDTAYNLLGDTAALDLGVGSTTIHKLGWTVGGGIEYALTNHVSAFVEYDHIGLPSAVVNFPTVDEIDAETISVRQSIDLFKLGVNYKFDLAALGSN